MRTDMDASLTPWKMSSISSSRVCNPDGEAVQGTSSGSTFVKNLKSWAGVSTRFLA